MVRKTSGKGFFKEMIFGGKKPRNTRTPRRTPLLKGILTPAGRRAQNRPSRYTHHRKNTDSRGRKVYFQGDRIAKGDWSAKRWNKAIKKDSKRVGKRYEFWEKPHYSSKAKKMVKAESWK